LGVLPPTVGGFYALMYAGLLIEAISGRLEISKVNVLIG